MRNYALEWKHKCNFKELNYSDSLDILSKIPKFYISEKIDGILGALIYDRENDICVFQTTTGAIIQNIPVLDEYKRLLDKIDDYKKCILVGDLVAVKNGKVLPWNESVSIIKTYRKGNNADYICHFLYDVYEIDGNILSNMYEFDKPLEYILLHRSHFSQYCQHIKEPLIREGNIWDFKKIYESSVMKEKPGVEGLVVRTAKKNFKVKPVSTLDLAVIGFGNENMPLWKENQISYLLLAYLDDHNNFVIASKVGTGFNRQERKDLFSYCMKNKIERSPVKGEWFIKPGMIVQINFLHTNDITANYYKYENNTYKLLGKRNSLSLTHPRFERIRTDKRMNEVFKL